MGVVGEQRLHGLERREHLEDERAVRVEGTGAGLREADGVVPGLSEAAEPVTTASVGASGDGRPRSAPCSAGVGPTGPSRCRSSGPGASR